MEKFQELFRPENKNRVDRWNDIGLETIRADLTNNDRAVYVGGSPDVRRLARLWVEYKDHEKAQADKKITFTKRINHPWTVRIGGGLIVALILYLISFIF